MSIYAKFDCCLTKDRWLSLGGGDNFHCSRVVPRPKIHVCIVRPIFAIILYNAVVTSGFKKQCTNTKQNPCANQSKREKKISFQKLGLHEKMQKEFVCTCVEMRTACSIPLICPGSSFSGICFSCWSKRKHTPSSEICINIALVYVLHRSPLGLRRVCLNRIRLNLYINVLFNGEQVVIYHANTQEKGYAKVHAYYISTRVTEKISAQRIDPRFFLKMNWDVKYLFIISTFDES